MFLVYACAVKAISAYGGPAIVLASVTFAAHIISEDFYVSLVMLAWVTSIMEGAWLEAVFRRRESIVDELMVAGLRARGRAGAAGSGAVGPRRRTNGSTSRVTPG